ncbi:MAG: acyl-CoA dehydrogenase family protein [Rugosibacter sp.]|nr:acyl-CoA dehydrogenase family protein [Rugosibacter sp.]
MAQLTHEEAIKRAEYVGQIAEAELFEADRNGGYSTKLKDAIHETQLHRLMRPKRYGGFGMTHRTFSEVVRTVGQHSVSGAWVTYFMPLHETWVALLPPTGREEIFGSDKFVADIFFPIGKVEYVEGGLRLSGQWNWGSGIDFCEWIGLGAIVDVPGTTTGPQPCLVTIKVSEGDIIQNWDTFGLRGTGSKGIAVKDVFVPWHRVLPVISAKQSAAPMGGEFDPAEPVYRVPFMPAFALGFNSVCVGAMQRLQRELHARIRARQRVVLGGKEWESPVAQRNLGEVVTQIEQAEALHERYVKQLDDWCIAGTTTATPLEDSRMGAWRSSIAKTAAQTGFRALELLGGAAAYKGDIVEVFARDLMIVSIHVTQLYEDHMMYYGRAQYGLSAHPLG